MRNRMIEVICAVLGLGLLSAASPAAAETRQDYSVTVVGEAEKPPAATKGTSTEPMKPSMADPGAPNSVTEEGIAPKSTVQPSSSDEKKGPQTNGRAKAGGFPWWILLIIGVAAAAGAS